MLTAILGHDNTSSPGRRIMKGQLYNLEWDESITFQFNPESLEWERETEWARTSHRGHSQFVTPQFIKVEPREMEIPFLFVADPGAPSIEFQSSNAPLVSRAPLEKAGRFGFKDLRSIIESWESVIPTLGRPSRVRAIFGDISFDCCIERSRFKVTEFFGGDLGVRESLLTLEMKEWQGQA